LKLFYNQVHDQWLPILEEALKTVDPEYLNYLQKETHWLPGLSNLFAAFSQSVDNTRYILLGESPYPRARSANGYAFWDAHVESLWSHTGLSKEVNRATSLRNFIKMLLVARGDLSLDLSQAAISQLNKEHYIQTAPELFQEMIRQGFLLLNASLVFMPKLVNFHAKHWQPFMQSLFRQLLAIKPSIIVLLFGRVAAQVPEVKAFSCLVAEHPYNLSFIHNPEVLAFFNRLDLLSCYGR
jgi:uracil-DNA glycosylase